MRSDRDISGVIIFSYLSYSLRSRHIIIESTFHSGRKYRVYVPLKSFSRKPVVRYSVSEHSPKLRSLLKYCYFVPHYGQEECGRKTGGSSSYDGYLFTCIIHSLRYRYIFAVVYGESLESSYIYRRVYQGSPAPDFAGMFAYQSADSRERIVFSYESYGVIISACFQESYVSRYVYSRRAHGNARHRLSVAPDSLAAGMVYDM